MARPAFTTLVIVLSALAGWAVAAIFGRGFAPALPVDAPSFGIMQAIRLPVGARTKGDLVSFEVEMGGADDYARVYVNNYLTISTENPNAILLFTPETDPQEQLMSRLSVKRNLPAPGRKDVVQYLRKGANQIVFENENSIHGTCVASITLYANGKKLEGFPIKVPNRFYPERASLMPGAIELFERTKAAAATDDILCARRIFVFQVY